jgi:lysophospholipase L1-like esterase
MGGRIALVASAIVATLAVLEVACRVAQSPSYLLHWPNLVLDRREGAARYGRTAMTHDPELGFVPSKGHVRADATHDDDGMRLTPPLPGVAERPLLLATGDSFTYGAEVADGATWPSQLQGLLRLRVVNGGVSAYGLDQTVLRTERLAQTLRPAAIVVSFIADDLRRTELGRFVGLNKPHFLTSGDRLDASPRPVPPSPSAEQSLSFWHRAFGWSALLDTVLQRIDWPEDWPYDSLRVLPHGSGERMACPLMQRLASLSRPVLVVAQYDPAAWDDDAGLAAEQRRVTAVILRCAEQAGLATLDTFALLGAHGPRNLFMPEGHLTAEGNALTARAIATRLRQLGLAMQ